MPNNTEQVQYNHFTIPAQPNFLNETQLKLTEASKKNFEQGCPGQGYAGLVDIMTGEIHLIPAFNKNDGQLRLDKDGKSFTKYASTEQTLGGGAGDLHMRSASMLSLGDKGGNQGKLMGFGIWKGGQSVKFLSEIPENKLRLIPDEYLVIKDQNNEYKIYYVSLEKEIQQIPLNQEQLEALANLPKDKSPEELNFEERRTIENTLPIRDPGDLKLIKNRSSSQNMFSCKYDPTFGSFFNHMMPEGHGGSHQVALQREIPLPILSKIVNSICVDINLNPIDALENSPLIPNEENDNRLRYHLQVESFYIRFQKILEKIKGQTKENQDLIAKYYNAGNTKMGDKDTNIFLSQLESLVKMEALPIEMFELLVKNQSQNTIISKIFDPDFRALITDILRDNPDALKDLMNAIDTDLKQPDSDTVAKTIYQTLIQYVQNNQLKVTNENIKLIAKVIIGKMGHHSDFISLITDILGHSPDAYKHLINAINSDLKQADSSNVSNTVTNALIECLEKSQIEVTNTNVESIRQILIGRIGHQNENYETLFNTLTLLKQTNKVDTPIIDSIIQEETDNLLKKMLLKTLAKTADASENNKMITLLESQDNLKSKSQLLTAHFIQHLNEYQKSSSFPIISEMIVTTNTNFNSVLHYAIICLKEVNANDAFKELAKNIITQNPKDALYFLKIAQSDDWPILHETLKEIMPNEYFLYTTLKEKLNISNAFSFGNTPLYYKFDVNPENNLLALSIYPPTIVIGNDGDGDIYADPSFKDSMPDIMTALKDLGFPKEVLDKVHTDLSANPNVTSYVINLDKATQSAIISKNQVKQQAPVLFTFSTQSKRPENLPQEELKEDRKKPKI